MNYIIHTCKDRLWYVQDYLQPSLCAQGIPEENIFIFVDINNKGNLYHCMDIFSSLKCLEDNTWHLQDDIIVSAKFKQRTYKLERSFEGIVCGFCSNFDCPFPASLVEPDKMWYSFPCIRIPNYIAKECAEWFYSDAINNKNYAYYIQHKKFDDVIFKDFVKKYYPDVKIYNAIPNLVNHIDYMIGGSIVNKERGKDRVMAYFWEENYIIEELENKLALRNI